MTDYACARCGKTTTKGAMIGYADGTFIAVSLCPIHMDETSRKMKADGVPVHNAAKQN